MLPVVRYRAFVIASMLGMILTACDSKAPPAAGQAPVEVGVAVLATTDVPLAVELPGRTSAFRKAEVRPQVSGVIQKRLFTEGAVIKANEPLYQIDPATYEAASKSASAELARAEANQVVAAAREARYKNLIDKKLVSQQDYDDTLASLQQAKASVLAAKAAVDTARINLKYTRVLAPISGIIGKSSVTEGALVTAGQVNVLAEILQLDPIYVDVSQSAEEVLHLRRQILQGDVKALEAAKVDLLLGDGTRYEHQGSFQFAEVGVNETTGSVTLRAIFPNPDRLLLPGMFVRAQLQEGLRTNAVLVPQRGVTRDRTGKASALVVNAEGVAELRTVALGRAVGDQWLVLDGLTAGDQVIVDGLQKVRPGAPVKPSPISSSDNKAAE